MLPAKRQRFILRINGVVEPGVSVWAFPHNAHLETMPPRPETDYSLPVACPSCGVTRPKGRTETHCVPCFNTGHDYRLMGRLELLWSAHEQAVLGYPEVAARRRLTAERLPVEPRELAAA